MSDRERESVMSTLDALIALRALSVSLGISVPDDVDDLIANLQASLDEGVDLRWQ